MAFVRAIQAAREDANPIVAVISFTGHEASRLVSGDDEEFDGHVLDLISDQVERLMKSMEEKRRTRCRDRRTRSESLAETVSQEHQAEGQAKAQREDVA